VCGAAQVSRARSSCWAAGRCIRALLRPWWVWLTGQRLAEAASGSQEAPKASDPRGVSSGSSGQDARANDPGGYSKEEPTDGEEPEGVPR
jgi:hypothetical protein